ncbi:MAG TPA: hypothetical protein VII92_13075 [Anaerolineae bacterium]
MTLPDPLPTDPDEIEKLYQEYATRTDDFDTEEFQRLMDARLAAWGIDPHHMTAEQLLGAMSESMNGMLMNLYAAQEAAPDDETSSQMNEIIRMAEQLREHIHEAVQDMGLLDSDQPVSPPAA